MCSCVSIAIQGSNEPSSYSNTGVTISSWMEIQSWQVRKGLCREHFVKLCWHNTAAIDHYKMAIKVKKVKNHN